MNKVFLDANVIFSAAYSATGGSAYIFQLAKKGKLILCSSKLAIKEAERNLGEKDSPILASAINSKAGFILTLDKKHFLNEKVLNAKLPIKIVTPSQFIEKYI